MTEPAIAEPAPVTFFSPEENKSIRFIPFYLSDDFVKGYSRKKVPWGPIGEFSFLRTYSRTMYLEGDKVKKERWHECIRRVVEGCFTVQKKHCFENKVPWDNAKAQDSAKEMFDLMFNMKFLPPGRGLWMMGTDYVAKHGSAALNNCAFISTKNIAQDTTSAFKFLMDMSMLGVGVGFDTKGAGKVQIQKPDYVKIPATVPDTREGWVEVMSIVLYGFLGGGVVPDFDYSKIRPAGALIKGFGGEASGPQPLIELVENIKNLFKKKVGKIISSTDIVDICDMIGKCVVSGNVRRSALISLGAADDIYFMDMKNYDLHPEQNGKEGWRWASNNSIRAKVGQDYNSVAERIGNNGEPGLVWMETAREYGRLSDPPNNADYKAEGCNPCGEQTLESYELCCLVETFPSRHESYEEYQKTLKYSYLYAKTVTLIPTHSEKTNAVMLRNRRIGESQSGIIEAFVKHGRQEMLEWCDNGYKYLRHLDNIYSDWMCIPRSIKITSVKPSGTISLLPGVTPGIHYSHAEWYIRRVTLSIISPLAKIMKDAGYKVEDSVTDKTACIVEFPIHSENFVKGKGEVTMWEQFINAADYQAYWCDNQVSITITFKPEEKRDIANALSIFDSKLKSVSLLPLENHGYKQAPYEEITEKQYDKMVSKLTKPDYSSFTEEAKGEKYCDGEACLVV